MNLRTIGTILVIAATAACAEHRPTVTQAGPGILEVDTGRGVALEVLDWGGSGRALVFLAGGGASTAHEFDDFAPRFANDFRVLGITRRGSGASSDVRPRRFSDLVDDIVAVLDALQLQSVVLVGHSFAGLEMALFGSTHGDRCGGLIYLDAAYDYTDPELVRILEAHQPPSAPPMQASDSASVEAVRDWYARTQGFRPTEAALRATRRFDAAGRMVGAITPGSARWRIESPPPRWESVICPSLGIFAVPAPPESWLPYWNALNSLQREGANAYYRAFAPWTEAARTAFAKPPQNQMVEFPSSNHYFFLEKPDEAERVMRDFLAKLR